SAQFEQVRSLRLQGKLQPARNVLGQATRVVVRLGARASIVRADFEAGCLERVMTGDERARPPFEKSLAQAESLGLRLEVAQNHEQLGEIAEVAADSTAACDHFAKSLALFELLNNTSAARVRSHLT